MNLEELMYTRLTQAAPLKRLLARYDKKPAVFYQKSPEDTADGWHGKRQYPRIDYIVDMQANPKRQTSGVLAINIYCSENSKPPEALEPEVRAALCDVFIQPEGYPPFCLAWARSDTFEQSKQPEPITLITGATVLFDVYAFPAQDTIDPDPILAMNEYVKDWAPQALVIGKDPIVDFYSATGEQPAFYFRLTALQTAKETNTEAWIATNTVAWMDGVIAGHIFASPEGQMKWLRSMVDTLALAGEVTMPDTSPMFIQNIGMDSAADKLTTGQLRLNVRFGILRRPEYAHTLMKPNITMK